MSELNRLVNNKIELIETEKQALKKLKEKYDSNHYKHAFLNVGIAIRDFQIAVIKVFGDSK